MHYTTCCNTQSSVPEDGQNNCPKHVEFIGIINQPLWLHLVGCIIYINDARSSKYQKCESKFKKLHEGELCDLKVSPVYFYKIKFGVRCGGHSYNLDGEQRKAHMILVVKLLGMFWITL